MDPGSLEVATGEDSHKNRSSASIYMVPSTIRILSPSSYSPRLVSIGPLHREDEEVQASEGLKTSYLISLLSRTNIPKEKLLESCVRKVHASLEQIKACYFWNKVYDATAIVEMMVVDACFILEFVLKYLDSLKKPYSGRVLLVQTIMHDLVLLENQIPLFVLDEIFQCTVLKFDPKASLVDLLLPVLSCNNLFKADININNVSINDAPHMLSLLHQCYRPQTCDVTLHSPSSRVHSVVDLPDKTSVTFKPNKDPTMELESYRSSCLFGFWNRPTLRMPVLCVDDHTESVLRNLIAYEQQPYPSCKCITSYVYAMGLLVDTPEDVARLVDSGVLVHYMGSNAQAASIIKTVLKHCMGLL